MRSAVFDIAVSGLAAEVRAEEHPIPADPPSPRDLLPLRDVLLPVVRTTVDRAMDLALNASGQDEQDGRTGCVVGLPDGNWSTAEYILKVVRKSGASWIDPRSFLHYPDHALAADLCISRQLDGPSVTLVGKGAELDAFGFGAFLVDQRRCERVLVIAADWPTALTQLAVEVDRPRLRVTAAVLEAESGSYRLCGWRPTAIRAPAGADEDGHAQEPQPRSASATLLAPLVDWYFDPRPAEDLAVRAGSARLRFRYASTGGQHER